MKSRIALAICVLALAILACGNPAPEYVLRGWTVTPSEIANATQTALVVFVEITNSPEPTQTPALVIITQTPNALATLCVTAKETVYLRTQPNTAYDAIAVLPNGAEVENTGTVAGFWYFVGYQDKKGWVHSAYLGNCD